MELTESQKFVLQLGAEVSTYMNIHKAAYFGQAKNIEKLIESKAPADAYDVEVRHSGTQRSTPSPAQPSRLGATGVGNENQAGWPRRAQRGRQALSRPAGWPLVGVATSNRRVSADRDHRRLT